MGKWYEEMLLLYSIKEAKFKSELTSCFDDKDGQPLSKCHIAFLD